MLHIGYILLGFAGTELFAWALHKYLMHGVLWFIHRTHHEKHEGRFELNDVFSLLFGSIAVILMILGLRAGIDPRFFVGLGITLYGAAYFVVHDVWIHRRYRWFRAPDLPLVRGLLNAHRAHHRSRERDKSEAFGLFMVRPKYFRQSTEHTPEPYKDQQP